MTRELTKLIEEVKYAREEAEEVNIASLPTVDILKLERYHQKVQGLLSYLNKKSVRENK